jgi:sec-independent protein translocase protein TatC
VSIPTEDPRAATGATPATNGTASHSTDGTSLTPASETVQSTSSTTDAPVAPVLYEPALPPASPPPPDTANGLDPLGDAPEEEEDGMTMLEHLEELRNRIVVCAVALAVGLVISALPIPWVTQLSVTQEVIRIVSEPAADHLIFIKPGEGFVTYFQVAMIVAVVLALPVITYQLIAFVLPALLPHEKKYLYMAIPGAMGSFAIGLFFGYILVIPVAIQFLLVFGTENIPGLEVKWAFSEYIETVTTLLFWMGISFETPLLMFFRTELRVSGSTR